MSILARIRTFIRSVSNIFRRTNIMAVHDSDVVQLLESLGIYRQVASGSVMCASCGVAVTLENLWAIRRHGGTYQLICLSPSCASLLDPIV
jgi:hypothetical protein